MRRALVALLPITNCTCIIIKVSAGLALHETGALARRAHPPPAAGQGTAGRDPSKSCLGGPASLAPGPAGLLSDREPTFGIICPELSKVLAWGGGGRGARVRSCLAETVGHGGAAGREIYSHFVAVLHVGVLRHLATTSSSMTSGSILSLFLL